MARGLAMCLKYGEEGVDGVWWGIIGRGRDGGEGKRMNFSVFRGRGIFVFIFLQLNGRWQND